MIEATKLNELFNSGKYIVLELGPGNFKRIPDSLTVDILPLPGVDIVADLNDGLSFLPDNSIDRIYSHHVLEHVENLELLLKEVIRVLKPNGVFDGEVPHFSNPYFYSDYTHKSAFGLYSFSYFSKQRYFKRTVPTFYSDINFDISRITLVFKSPFLIINILKKSFQLMINAHKLMQEVYEENLAYLMPAYEISFKLIKKK